MAKKLSPWVVWGLVKELRTAAEEQAKISRLRLTRLVEELRG